MASRGWCKKHYHRWHRTGDPEFVSRRPPGELQALINRGASADHDKCILVEGHKGRPKADRSTLASRAAWIAANGDPGERHVLHTCHDDRCININHLYLGDAQRNMEDMVEADRHLRGERNHWAVLTEAQVLAIRRRVAAGERRKIVADDYGISVKNVSNIVRRISWKHI